jgi:CRISPR/Cas system CMR subunit Cmr4 (Cas7 group RAMP superfamily)
VDLYFTEEQVVTASKVIKNDAIFDELKNQEEPAVQVQDDRQEVSPNMTSSIELSLRDQLLARKKTVEEDRNRRELRREGETVCGKIEMEITQ